MGLNLIWREKLEPLEWTITKAFPLTTNLNDHILCQSTIYHLVLT